MNFVYKDFECKFQNILFPEHFSLTTSLFWKNVGYFFLLLRKHKDKILPLTWQTIYVYRF